MELFSIRIQRTFQLVSTTLNKEKLSYPLKKEIFPFKEFISFITFVLVF